MDSKSKKAAMTRSRAGRSMLPQTRGVIIPEHRILSQLAYDKGAQTARMKRQKVTLPKIGGERDGDR